MHRMKQSSLTEINKESKLWRRRGETLERLQNILIIFNVIECEKK
jgi:hypothetical protein